MGEGSATVVLWRGISVEVRTGAPRVAEAWLVHDLGPALYATTQAWLGEVFAYVRYSQEERRGPGGAVRPVLLRATVPARLIYGARSVDLTTGAPGRLWKSFMTGDNRLAIDYLAKVPRQHIQRHFYFELFQEFQARFGRALSLPEDPSVIIAPEYPHSGDTRPGVQVAIRDPEIRASVERMFREWGPPQWIRVKDRNGVLVDVNINDPIHGFENRRYVDERLREAGRVRVSEREARRVPRSSPPTGRARGVRTATALIAVDAAMFGLDVYSTFRHIISEVDERRRKVMAVASFWSNFGVTCQLLGLTTARGSDRTIVIRGSEDWSGIELFPAFVFGVLDPPETNPLDLNLTRMLDLLAFLHLGQMVGALVSHEADRGLPSYSRRWYLRVKAAVPAGGYVRLDDVHVPISPVVARIMERCVGIEEQTIGELTRVTTPYRSRARGEGFDELEVRTGAHVVFRDGVDQEVFATRQRPGRSRQAILSWPTSAAAPQLYDYKGRAIPSFLQIGENNVGDPPWLSDALLVTGANPTTNASLYSALLMHDGEGLIAEVRSTGARDSRGGGTYEPTYTVVPMVYLKRGSTLSTIWEE